MFSMRWFRRHQTGMMIFFGVGLMAIFGLGSVVGMLNPGDIGRKRVDPVAVAYTHLMMPTIYSV